MRNANRTAWAIVILGLSIVALGGCGKPAEAPQQELIFYPPPPDQPRLQFLTSFSNLDPWLPKRSSFADFIAGKQDEGQDQTKIVSPYGLAARNGVLFICDLGAHRVHVLDIKNKSYAVLQPVEQTPNPVNIAIDSDGTRYVCDTSKRRIVVFDAQNRYVRDIGDPTKCVPSDVAIWDGKLVVADVAGGEVEVWDKSGKVLRVISSKGTGPSQLRLPTNLAVSPDGQIFVADTELATVKQFDSDGKYVKSFGAPGDRPGFFARPKGVALDPQNRLYVADAQWEVVQIFDPTGQLLLFFGGAAPGPQGMGLPAGLAIDPTSLDAFKDLVSDNFVPEYLLFVANQFGVNKIGIYAFGHAKEQPAANEESPPAANEAGSTS